MTLRITGRDHMYLCGDSTFHHADIEMRRSSFVHLYTAVGDYKHSPIWQLNIRGPQRLELYQLRLSEKSQSLKPRHQNIDNKLLCIKHEFILALC